MSTAQFPTEHLMRTALEIAERRKDTQRRLKLAIRERNWKVADQLITELVPDNEESNRTHSRKYRIAGGNR